MTNVIETHQLSKESIFRLSLKNETALRECYFSQSRSIDRNLFSYKRQNLIHRYLIWLSSIIFILIAMIGFIGTYTYFKKEDLK